MDVVGILTAGYLQDAFLQQSINLKRLTLSHRQLIDKYIGFTIEDGQKGSNGPVTEGWIEKASVLIPTRSCSFQQSKRELQLNFNVKWHTQALSWLQPARLSVTLGQINLQLDVNRPSPMALDMKRYTSPLFVQHVELKMVSIVSGSLT